jgi:hypothetical protein
VTLTVIAVACVGAWLGIASFFSFAVAPTLFRLVDRAVAGEAVAVVLPRYYGTGLGLSAAALGALLLRTARERGGRRGGLAACALAAVLAGVLAWSLFGLLPQAEAARLARDDVAFALAHRRAVSLNLVTMILGMALLAIEAVRRETRSPTG